jgi:hypothetical protein
MSPFRGAVSGSLGTGLRAWGLTLPRLVAMDYHSVTNAPARDLRHVSETLNA